MSSVEHGAIQEMAHRFDHSLYAPPTRFARSKYPAAHSKTSSWRTPNSVVFIGEIRQVIAFAKRYSFVVELVRTAYQVLDY